MLAYTFYETDNRVKRYAMTLAKRGDHVDVIGLRPEGQSDFANHDGINVYRIQERVFNENGQFAYLVRLLRFLVHSAILLTRKHLKEPYDVIHVHNVPDFLVFAALIPKIKGAKIILDIHDLMPELYAGKFNSGGSVLYNLLVLTEKVSAAFSDRIIVSNHIWEKKLSSRSCKEGKCAAILNYPDNAIFYRRPRKRKDGKIIFIYPGTFGWHQGLDIAIRAFKLIEDRAPEAELHIYGDGNSKDSLARLIAEAGLERKVFIRMFLPIEKIADVMAEADIGIVPKRADSFGNEAFSTKIFEFMALGVPVIASNTTIDRFYFNDSIVKFFRSGDELDLAEKMLLLVKDKAARDEIAGNASRYISENSWDVKKGIYLDIIDGLAGNAR